MGTPHERWNDSRAASKRDLPRLQGRLSEIGRSRERTLHDLNECRHRAAQFTGAQRILREQAFGIELDTYLAGLEESLANEWETEGDLQARLVQLATEKREVIAAINRLVNAKQRGSWRR